ncbi:hypothetical protein [Pseudomonas sp. Marseille-Q7302]
MDQTTKRGRPSKLRLSQEQEDKYITTRSHSGLAKELGCKLSELKTYAEENGLDEESRLYWLDVAAERLKEAVESPETDEVSAAHINALKSLLSNAVKYSPGRPSAQKEFAKGKREAQHEYEQWEKEVERMKGK